MRCGRPQTSREQVSFGCPRPSMSSNLPIPAFSFPGSCSFLSSHKSSISRHTECVCISSFGKSHPDILNTPIQGQRAALQRYSWMRPSFSLWSGLNSLPPNRKLFAPDLQRSIYSWSNTMPACKHKQAQSQKKFDSACFACYRASMTEEQSMQSKGGEARKNALSPEQRSEIARNAAMAKWEKSETVQKLPKATHGSPDHPLRIGRMEIPCYVLDNGKRVITQSGVLAALSMSPGTATKGGGDRIANFVNTKSINPYASNELRDMITNPIKFRAQGTMAYGYEATILPEICEAVLKARNSEKGLNYQQAHIAKQAEILLLAFAKVGIIALVDEATGYQEIRDRQALSEILKKYIDGALYEWAKTFPLSLYKEIFRLKGWAWNNGKMPQVVGHYTNDLVYDRLTKGMLEELKRINPKDAVTGRRKHRNYQFLTPEIGYPALNQRLYELLGMARASANWEEFYRLVDRTFPRVGDTPRLPFDEDV